MSSFHKLSTLFSILLICGPFVSDGASWNARKTQNHGRSSVYAPDESVVTPPQPEEAPSSTTELNLLPLPQYEPSYGTGGTSGTTTPSRGSNKLLRSFISTLLDDEPVDSPSSGTEKKQLLRKFISTLLDTDPNDSAESKNEKKQLLRKFVSVLLEGDDHEQPAYPSVDNSQQFPNTFGQPQPGYNPYAPQVITNPGQPPFKPYVWVTVAVPAPDQQPPSVVVQPEPPLAFLSPNTLKSLSG